MTISKCIKVWGFMYFWEDQSMGGIHSAQQLREMEQNEGQLFDPKVFNQFIKDTNETLQRQDKEIGYIHDEIKRQNARHEKEMTENLQYNKSMKWIAIIAALAAIGSFIVSCIK